MKHYVLLYDYVSDFLEKRAPHRMAHLNYAKDALARGELQLGGAFTDAPAGAMLLFKVEDPAIIEAFARQDPYVIHGVVTGWRVREWTTVLGADALTPIPS